MTLKELQETLDSSAKAFRADAKQRHSKKQADDVCAGFNEGQANAFKVLMSAGAIRFDVETS
jgi:hypothetical protein